MILAPNQKDTHNALRDAENGAIFDWNFSNRHKLIEYYSKGYELQPNPKYSDSLEAISHIYEIQGKYDMAIEKLQEIIALLESDWKITEGETVDFYKRGIEKLKIMLNKQV